MKTANRIHGFDGIRRLYKPLAVVAASLGLLLAVPAFADEAADVSKMMHAGQLNEALSRADAFLAQKPGDAQMRFLKGLILTEQNKSTEAIAIFAKLTEDYPALPEPYNNLAVLYAAAGQYDKARAALEMAIKTNPSYATAYENLGDVHAKLASQAYDKALQLDSSNSGAKAKLTLLHSLGGNAGAGAKAPVMVAQAPKQASPAVRTETPAAAQAKVETPKPQAKAASNDADKEDVLGVVHGWARAWSDQDVKAYLSFYGNSFDPPGRQSRKAWEEERRSRIVGKGRIEVKVESPNVTIEGNTATVRFRQIYTSDRLKADSHKTLVLVRQGGKWQIEQERVGG